MAPNSSFKPKSLRGSTVSGVRVHRENTMNIKALIFALAGAFVAAVYALESFLSFQANGFTAPLLVKVLLCGIGIYFFWRNARRIKKSRADGSSANAG